MNNKVMRILAPAAALLLAGGGYLYLRKGMGSPEVLRKLSGLRVSLELYSMERRRKPASFEDIIKEGQLEGAPALKLPGHRGTSHVRNAPAFAISDTGGWAYVNAPDSRDFGTIFIDCAHKDEKGRFWSEF